MNTELERLQAIVDETRADYSIAEDRWGDAREAADYAMRSVDEACDAVCEAKRELEDYLEENRGECIREL